MIPDETIAEVRTRVDIVAVIGQHVQLRKAGRNWKGLCPFHGEKTPSFNVLPERGFFNCFGCGKKGDAFSFVMELEGKSFIEVVEQFAERLGIEIVRTEESPELRKLRGERARSLDLNKLATEFYAATLADPQRGAAGRAYLAKRGVDDETRARFQLGFAPTDWGALTDHLTTHRADMDLATRLGLISPRRSSGGFYDRFRDRLVCPVIVPGGEVVGFSSRIVGSMPPEEGRDEPPKYVNSPESPIYKKSRLLFGLAQAREAIASKKRVILVEGNFDVISMHQAGLRETVAPLGTALTAEQVEILRRQDAEIILCYDGDRAGKSATRAAVEMLVSGDLKVKVITLPDGQDPDSLIKTGSPEAMNELIARAPGGIEFFCFEVWGKAAANSADGRARAVDDAARFIGKVASQTKRDLILGTLATALGVEAQVIRNAVAREGSGNRQDRQAQGRDYRGEQRSEQPGGGSGQPSAPAGDAPGPVSTRAEGSLVMEPRTHEIDFLGLLADHPSLIATPDADKAFSLLTNGLLRDIYSAARAGSTLHELVVTHLPPSLAKHVLSGKYVTAANVPAQLARMVDGFADHKRQLDAQMLSQQLAEAKRAGDAKRINELFDEIVKLRKQVH